MTISLATLAVVLVLIAVRRIGSLRIALWQAMLGGALIVLVTGEVTPVEAARAIDPDVVQGAERHGAQLSFRDFTRVGIPLTLLQLPVYLLYLVCVY